MEHKNRLYSGVWVRIVDEGLEIGLDPCFHSGPLRSSVKFKENSNR